MNVADFVLAQLGAWGVRHLYGITGDAILPLMDRVAQQQALRFVPVRHEAAAGFMASAECKLTGRLAVCVTTSGPGLANLINGLGDAYADRVPLLAISGQVKRDQIGTGVKQDIDQQLLVAAVAGYSALIADAAGAPRVLHRALKTAVGEGRVAHISLPKDLWSQPLNEAPLPPEPYLTAPPVVPPAVLDRAAGLMREAERPLILVGDGARPAADALRGLAQSWGAGLLYALGGKGIIAETHPLMLGGVGTGGSDAAHRALARADMLFVAGSTWWPRDQMPSGLRVIQLDRSPANIGSQTRVEFGLPGDSAQVVPGLLERLQRHAGAPRQLWGSELTALKQAWERKRQDEATVQEGAEGPVPPAYLMRSLREVAPEGSIITLDTGDHLLWFNRAFPAVGHRLLFSGTWRSMGFALPAAAAACLAEPGAPVFAVVGDGALLTQLGELAVPVQQGLKLTLILVRNQSLALEEHKARQEGLMPFGHQLSGPDFATVAAAFGWRAYRVGAPQQLPAALKQAVEGTGPALVEVITANDPSLHLPGQ